MTQLETIFSDIANAIKTKQGMANEITPFEMSTHINNIPGGDSNILHSGQSVIESFNQPVSISSSVTNCFYMFNGCRMFNQSVSIPSKVTSCYGMFGWCTNFNQPITIPANVTNCHYMFEWCINFNQPITIPKNAKDCGYMFNHCENWNQPITIPANVTNCASMFGNCPNLGCNINILMNITNNQYNNLRGFIRGKNSQKQLNIFCKVRNTYNTIRNTTNSYSILDTSVTWTNINTYAAYNTAYNVYIYYNSSIT